MERNPEWRGEAPAFDEIQFIRYGSAATPWNGR